jgi:hypothetical protein
MTLSGTWRRPDQTNLVRRGYGGHKHAVRARVRAQKKPPRRLVYALPGFADYLPDRHRCERYEQGNAVLVSTLSRSCDQLGVRLRLQSRPVSVVAAALEIQAGRPSLTRSPMVCLVAPEAPT